MPKKQRQATRTTPGFTGPFKGQPQPGTLFDVRTLPKTGEEIGPRGYSLNRSRQFQSLFAGRSGYTSKPGQVRLGVHYRERKPGEPYWQATSESRGTTPAVGVERHPFGPAALGPKHFGEKTEEEMAAKPPDYYSSYSELAKSMGRARSKMVDVLARSTVSPEQMKGLGDIRLHPKDPGYAGTYHAEQPSTGKVQTGGEKPTGRGNIKLYVTETSHESYHDEGPWTEEDAPTWVKQPKQRGPVDPESEMTLLHEVGHHVSHLGGTRHSQYRSPGERGREEAFADRFMQEHYREDPRSARWRGHTDPRGHSYYARGGLEEKFGSGAAQYREDFPAEYRPVKDVSRGFVPGRTLEESHVHERRLRPMLDEPLPTEQQVFNMPMKGWTREWDDPESQRRGAYMRATQRTNVAVSRSGRGYQSERAEIKRRWGSLSPQQFGQT